MAVIGLSDEARAAYTGAGPAVALIEGGICVQVGRVTTAEEVEDLLCLDGDWRFGLLSATEFDDSNQARVAAKRQLRG